MRMPIYGRYTPISTPAWDMDRDHFVYLFPQAIIYTEPEVLVPRAMFAHGANNPCPTPVHWNEGRGAGKLGEVGHHYWKTGKRFGPT